MRWLYSDAPATPKGQAALEAIVRQGYAQGLRYVRDEDARPTGSAHPDGALWDDGPDAIAGLAHVMQVRRLALSRFGPGNIAAGAPLSELRRVVVPIYLFHRYEVNAVSKSIGGVDFTYATRGDNLAAPRRVDGGRQRQALDAMLATLDPGVLDLPDRLIDQLSAGFDGAPDKAFDVEQFGRPHTPVFDLGAAADAAADITLADLLEPSRLERVAEQGSRDPSQLGLAELLSRTVDTIFRPPGSAAGAPCCAAVCSCDWWSSSRRCCRTSVRLPRWRRRCAQSSTAWPPPRHPNRRPPRRCGPGALSVHPVAEPLAGRTCRPGPEGRSLSFR